MVTEAKVAEQMNDRDAVGPEGRSMPVENSIDAALAAAIEGRSSRDCEGARAGDLAAPAGDREDLRTAGSAGSANAVSSRESPITAAPSVESPSQ